VRRHITTLVEELQAGEIVRENVEIVSVSVTEYAAAKT
jgi:hypothetical protein